MFHQSPERQTGGQPVLRSRSRQRREETSVNLVLSEKKVSPLWLFTSLPFLTSAVSGIIAPRMDVYTVLVCKILRPEYPDASYIQQILAEDHTRAPARSFLVDTLNQPSQSCATDPVVQAGLSKLVAVLMITSGIVSCITTGWWGAFSDRHGRNCVLAISVFGMVLSSLNVIFVYLFASSLPGNYWFLLVGSIMEALLGGPTTIWAAIEAYVVDCTDSSSRSRMLSMVTGILAAGVTLGPTASGFLIHASHQVLSVFYCAIVMFICFVAFVLTLLPESLSQGQMLANKTIHAARQQGGPILATFVAPLTIFLPTRLETVPESSGMDWNLTLIAIVYAIVTTLLMPVTHLLQYTSYVFGWKEKTTGYWLSSLGMTNTIFCLFILPVTIRWLKTKSLTTGMSLGPSEPLYMPVRADGDSPQLPSPLPSLEESHTSAFDLSLARVSLLIYLVFFTIMGLASNPQVFTVASIFGQLGAGYLPGLHSVAMEMFVLMQCRNRKEGENGLMPVEVGKLYGSLAVIQAFCSQALGPGLLALIFMFTVASVPNAIFLLIVAGISISIYLLSLVQLPNVRPNDVEHHD